MSNGLAATSIGTASVADWLTPANLVIIAIGAVLALLVIIWGARLKRQRKATDIAIGDRAAARRAEEDRDQGAPAPLASASLDDMPPRAPETDPAPRAPETEPAPVAPAPPPLADTPVVATAPFDAPATIAAELATPPAPAEPVAAQTDMPSGADELTTLKGVGPKLAARLRELGITRFAQIAALSPQDAAALDAQLGSFQGRMTRDRWVEQAGYLAKGDRAGFEAEFGKL